MLTFKCHVIFTYYKYSYFDFFQPLKCVKIILRFVGHPEIVRKLN